MQHRPDPIDCYVFTCDAAFKRSDVAKINSKRAEVADVVYLFDADLTNQLTRGVVKLRGRSERRSDRRRAIHRYVEPVNSPIRPIQPPRRLSTNLVDADNGYDQVLDSIAISVPPKPARLASKPSRLTSVDELTRTGSRPLPPTPRLNRKSVSATFVAMLEDELDFIASLAPTKGNDAQPIQLRNSENDYDEIEKFDQEAGNDAPPTPSAPQRLETPTTAIPRKSPATSRPRDVDLPADDLDGLVIIDDQLFSDDEDGIIGSTCFTMPRTESSWTARDKLLVVDKLSGETRLDNPLNRNASLCGTGRDRPQDGNESSSGRTGRDELENIVAEGVLRVKPGGAQKSDVDCCLVDKTKTSRGKREKSFENLTRTCQDILKVRSRSEEILRRSNVSLTLANTRILSGERRMTPNRPLGNNAAEDMPQKLIYSDISSDEEFSDDNDDSTLESELSQEVDDAKEGREDLNSDASKRTDECRFDLENGGFVDVEAGSTGRDEDRRIVRYINNFQENRDCLIVRKNELVVAVGHRAEPIQDGGFILLRNKYGTVVGAPAQLLKTHKSESSNYFLYPHRLTEKQATYFLMGQSESGSFLVYSTRSDAKDYRLSMRYLDRILHYGIEYNDEGYYRVETSPKRFYCLLDLIKYYRSNRAALATRLTTSVLHSRRTNPSPFPESADLQVRRDLVHFDGNILGNGEFGIICLGSYGGEACVVKTYKSEEKEFMNHYTNEICILSELAHVNIVDFKGYNAKAFPYYLIVEYCARGSLRNYSQSAKETNSSKINYFIFQMLTALVYLKRRKYVIHRDVRLQNFFLTGRDVVKMGEFGRARLVGDDSFTAELDEEIFVKYAAREVLRRQIYSSKSDIWSFAVTAWELYSAVEAFSNFTAEDVINHVTTGGKLLSRPLQCPGGSFKMLEKCWRFDPESRPTAEQLREHFRAKLRHYDEINVMSNEIEKKVNVAAECRLDKISNSELRGSTSSREELQSAKNKIKQTIHRFSFTKK